MKQHLVYGAAAALALLGGCLATQMRAWPLVGVAALLVAANLFLSALWAWHRRKRYKTRLLYRTFRRASRGRT